MAQDFDGLLYIGSLTSKFEYLHHTNSIRTLKFDELLIAAQRLHRIAHPASGSTKET